ncbi:ATP-binding protein [Candidatus Manganitrophus noduliformans]|uniref:histidine kinase n=1 Tax=Candidatus Manganitrophus noduliformans TaxID=2606439 RepID=A0A7X6DRY8_9BACT|nr:ATP-binding protein [Candidatus Manganitrophus noduliformans]NKE71973.1 response regulator [Candidatus Manganitrophus noduliformans]
MEKVNILLVDDHPENLVALEAILDSPFYRLIKAASGVEALKHLLLDEFALILLDVAMPDLDGFETAVLIKKRPKLRDIPIIFLTAFSKDEPFIFRGYSVGAVDYVFKPFEPMVLRSKVAVFAELFRNREQIKRQGELLRQSERREHERRFLEQEWASQKRYRHLADAVPQIIWTAGRDGAVDYFNQQWHLYTGLTLEQCEGWKWKRAIHPEDLPRLLQQWREALQAGQRLEVECRLKKADGTFRWHLFRAIPEAENGVIVAWLGTATDIDYQKQAETFLKQKTLEAEEGNRLKSEFVSNVSHELRTPLHAILGYSDLLSEESGIKEEQSGWVKGIHRNASDLLDLVNNLLDLSKIESGKGLLNLKQIDLKEVVPGFFDNIGSLTNGKEIQINLMIDEKLRVIQSDPLKIRQIFLNLLSNAIKFTERGVITTTLSNREGGILLTIQDTGIGMRPEDLPYIFDPFRQIDGSITRKAGGTGLGLAIVKNAVTALNGTIEVRSEPGKGSTFKIFLPEFPFDRFKPVKSRIESNPDQG